MPWYLEALLSIPFGLLLGNFTEWWFHRFVLHGWGKKPGKLWSFHFHEHHRNARKHNFYDPCYRRFPLGWHAQGKEAWALLITSLLVSPLVFFVPWLTVTLWYCALNYYLSHKKSHDHPDWARQHLAWHYDHHMGPNPHANWCVTKPWFDWVFGTREYYIGSEREQQDQAKRQRNTAATA